MGEHVELHCSSIGDGDDCARRMAQRVITKELEAMGHVFAPKRKGVGAEMGTSLHALAAEVLRTKLVIGEVNWVDIEAAVDKVFPDFMEACGKDVIWDQQVTPTYEVAREQLKAMGGAFLPLLDQINPAKIEHEWEALVSPLGDSAIPVLLKGRIDYLDTRKELGDFKTGKTMPFPFGQMGGYTILGELNDEEIRTARVNFVPRKGMGSLNKIVSRSFRLNIDECKQSAWSTIKQFQRHYMDFKETGDPWSFPANNKSMVCTPNYCDSHCTSWCKVGRISDSND